MKEIVKSAFVLFIITAVAAILLGTVYHITKNPIAAQQALEESKALKKLIPEATRFESSSILAPESSSISAILEAYGEDGLTGYVIQLSVGGYGGPIAMMVGLDTDGACKGVEILDHSETPGLGANAESTQFLSQFNGKDQFPLIVTKGEAQSNGIDAITAATITTSAITNGVNTAYEWYESAIGGGLQ